MNRSEEQLSRLFRAAAQAQPVVDFTAPYGLQARAMAAWRESRAKGHGFWEMPLLMRGLIVASVIMAVSFWPALTSTSNPFADFLQITDSTVSSDTTP